MMSWLNFSHFQKQKQKNNIYVDLVEINARRISSTQLNKFLRNLYLNERFQCLGYRTKKNGNHTRFVIYTVPGNTDVIQYFQKHDTHSIEDMCSGLTGITCNWETWDNGFREVYFD